MSSSEETEFSCFMILFNPCLQYSTVLYMEVFVLNLLESVLHRHSPPLGTVLSSSGMLVISIGRRGHDLSER